jgi:hypothetical protein
MPIASRLTDFLRPLALVVLIFAGLFFLYFGLSPAINLLPGGIDFLVGILIGLFVLVLLTSGRGKHRQR